MERVTIVQWTTNRYAKSCGICEAHNGDLFEISDPPIPFPPHWGCRCSLVPVVIMEAVGIDRALLVRLAIAEARRRQTEPKQASTGRVPKRHIRP